MEPVLENSKQQRESETEREIQKSVEDPIKSLAEY